MGSSSSGVNLAVMPSFGKSVAEKEGEFLNKYFLKTQTYLSTRHGSARKLFYVGHRGTGKTALFNRLISELSHSNKNILLYITPADFSYELFSKVEHDIYDIKTVYGIVWHYTLLICSYKAVIQSFDASKMSRYSDFVSAIKSYLKSNDLIESDNIMDIFFKFFRKFKIAKVGSKMINIEFESGDSDRKMLRLLNMTDIEPTRRAFNIILNTFNLHIFIDELDTGWNNTEEAHNFIYGLLYAVNKLRNKKGIDIYLSLRRDMYNNLPIFFTDAEKLMDDIEYIAWDKQALKALISLRIEAFMAQVNVRIPAQNALELVFDHGVLDYIIDHTLYRPREVIQYCNRCLEFYKKSLLLDIPHTGKINLNIAQTVENDFSNSRVEQICEEYKYQFPDLKDFVFLFEHSQQFFSYEEFRVQLQEKLIIFSEKHTDGTWLDVYYDHIEDLAKILFDIGFIKVYAPAFDRYFAYYELGFHDVGLIKEVKIHDLFCCALKLTTNC